MTLLAVIWVCISMVSFGLGLYCSKTYCLHYDIRWLFANLGSTIISTLTWLKALSYCNVISVAGMVWSLGTILTTAILGFCFFQEAFTLIKFIGLILACISIFLLGL